MDAALWRTQWLRAHTTEMDAEHLAISERACAAHVTWATQQVHGLHEAFEQELSLLKQGIYPPSVRVAMLTMQQMEEPSADMAAAIVETDEEGDPRRVVVVLNLVPVLSPMPRVADG